MSAQQTSLFDYEGGEETEAEPVDLGVLSEAEREAYENVREGEYGVTEFARETGRRKGTVGNLLSRAKDKLSANS